ncbi:MAG: TIGR02221 family CRISPR-associated protein [Candidatus Asgardarchaeum sp.]
MSSNKLLSFIGPTKYIEAFYSYEDKQTDEPCQFIQEALIRFFCKDWCEDDSIIIFLTEESKKKNWYSKKDFPNANFEKGLRERLEEIREEFNLNICIENIEIPDGKSENEIWNIFEKINSKIDEGDTIIFDITHSYRYLPMLTLVILNYVKFVKSVKIEKIVYGAMEALGNYNEVKDIPIKERIIPIFDLTSFVRLFDWTVAIERFLETGNARMIKELGLIELKPLLAETKGEKGKGLKNLINSLNYFSERVSTCRGPELKCAIERILEALPDAEKELGRLRPFGPLFEKIRERFSAMNIENEVYCGLDVASWCLEHGLIQQGYTILRETITNYVIIKNLKNEELTKKENRVIAEVMLNCKYEQIPNSILELWRNMGDFRNDINHAGWRDQNYHEPRVLEQKLRDFIKCAKDIIIV